MVSFSPPDHPAPSCEKKYLYPSSLKKHYAVSHNLEYEQYLKDKKSKASLFLNIQFPPQATTSKTRPQTK
jgi:hypothetical protein